MSTRQRIHTDQRGQVTTNWLAMMVGIVALTAAIAVALPAVAPTIVCSFQTMLSKVSGGAVPECNYTEAVDDDVPAATTCLVSERQGEAGVSVTVFSVKGGAKVKLITRRTADGHVYVTVEGGGEIGLEFGTPVGAEVSVDAGDTETSQGANARGGVALTGNGSLTWEFDSEADAHEFAEIVANRARDAALDTNPITGIGRHIFGVDEDRPIPAPTIFGLEGGVKIFGDADGGAGPLSGSAEGEIGPSIGGRYDSRRDQTTVYFKVNAKGKLGAQLAGLVGGQGLGEGEVQLAVTFDGDGNPIRATAIASGTVIGQLTGKLGGLSGKEGVAGERADIRLDLDLTDPTNREAWDNFIANPLTGVPGLVDRFANDSEVGARFYDADQTDVGVEAAGSIADVSFGLEVGGAYKEADLTSAYYYDRDSGTWNPWVECTR